MTITAYGSGAYRSAQPNSFVSSRTQFDDLQRQLSTKERSTSYGDLGIDRRVSLDLNAKISSLDSWLSGIDLADVNLKLMSSAVDSFGKMATESRNDMRSNTYLASSTGQTGPQVLAQEKFKQTLDLLNSDVNGRYLFSGRTSDTQPTLGYDEIINGSAGKDGLRQVMDERKKADLGSDGMGRLQMGMTGTTTVDLSDADHVYGFKLGDVSATGTGISVTAQTPAPAGTDAAFSISVTGQPTAGDKVNITLKLPDGTQEQVTLTARALGTTGSDSNSFEIGSDLATTAANLQNSIGAAIKTEAKTTLSAASSQVAAAAFFAGSASNPPQRVPGADPYTATAAPTNVGVKDTVIWYRGDDAADTARNTATVQVDQGQTVGTGARANEEAFRVGLAQFGIMAVESFPADDANSQARYNAMAERVGDRLGFGGTTQKPTEIITELGSAQTALASAKERHQNTKSYLTTTLSGVENVTTEEVATQILSLQTQLQASYQVTSMLSKLSLTNYL
ncbi:flagellin [Bosea thiooxidans]|nr:flagellin [Bosea sp. (in: a-proteobacteria)]